MTDVNRTSRGLRTPKTRSRLGYRISEWSELIGVSRQTTRRAIQCGALKTVQFYGLTIIPDSERERLGFGEKGLREEA